MILIYATVFSIGLVVSLVFAPAFIRLAVKNGIVDKPGPRRVNVRIIPRLGGPTIVLGFMAATAVFAGRIDTWPGVIAGGLIVFAVGVIDDVRGLRPGLKLAGQLAAAFIAYEAGVRIEFVSNPAGGMILIPPALSLALTIFWIIGITNAVNLIDGLDGLAAGIICIAALTFFLVAFQKGLEASAILSVALAGSTAGFLRWNFFPAKTFMGDSGAYFLGYMAAVIAVIGACKSTSSLTLLIPVLALGVPSFDTSFAIFRRYQHRKPIMAGADKGHLHHRLLGMGIHHRKAVILCYLITLVLSAVSLAIIRAWLLAFFLLLFVVLLTLLLIVAGKIYKRRPSTTASRKSG